MATETVELAAAYVQLVPSLKGVEGVIAKALGGSSGPVQEASRSLGQRIVSSISDAVTRSPKIAVAVMIENGEAGGRVAGPVVRQILDAWLLDQDGHLKAQYATPNAPPVNPKQQIAAPSKATSAP